MSECFSAYEILATATEVRYVRMYGTERGTQGAYSLWDLEVYGNLASNKSVTVSSLQDNLPAEEVKGSYAVDENMSTRWSSGRM